MKQASNVGETAQRPVICLLAHNEEKNISDTIYSILNGNREYSPRIKVYLNGCTDNSEQVVADIAKEHSQVEAVIIREASKITAWNLAFSENKEEILFFGDGDILHKDGAIGAILQAFSENPELELACCTSWPLYKGLHWQQKIVGFLQIPLQQDFLIGHFYAIKRKAFVKHLQKLELSGIPKGLVGDDAFIGTLIDQKNFHVVENRVFYEPPNFTDYIPYLARIRWQNEQIALFFKTKSQQNLPDSKTTVFQRIKSKIAENKSLWLLCLGGLSTCLRILFKRIFSRKITTAYKKLGPVIEEGGWILREATRSDSVK